MKDFQLGMLRNDLAQRCLMFLAGQPVVYHCHHFNLFLDQTIDDALGPADGARLRMKAGREFSARLIRAACSHVGAETPPECARVAGDLFRAMGHGSLETNADSVGGDARGTYLHYGHAWREKYGRKIRRMSPADAFACGFSAAATEVAHGLESGSLEAHEGECVAMRSSDCGFKITRSAEIDPPRKEVGQTESLLVGSAGIGGINEDVILPIVQGLREFTAGVAGDERGLIQAFGVFVTMHLAGYYNRISYDAMEEIRQRAPQSEEVLASLLRESGHVCVFNTFGGVLLSPEWEGLVGPVKNDPELIVTWSMAIARAFGFGRWSVTEFEPERRLVLRTPATYESIYYRARHGSAEKPNEYMLQGAALATAQLAHRVDFEAKPELTEDYYQKLFKGGVPWVAEQTKSVVCGDPYSEVVVTYAPG